MNFRLYLSFLDIYTYIFFPSSSPSYIPNLHNITNLSLQRNTPAFSFLKHLKCEHLTACGDSVAGGETCGLDLSNHAVAQPSRWIRVQAIYDKVQYPLPVDRPRVFEEATAPIKWPRSTYLPARSEGCKAGRFDSAGSKREQHGLS